MLQVANILFAVLKLGQSRSTSSTSSSNDPTIVSPQVKTKTKGGKHQSTSEEDLQHIMHQHPIVEVILAHRHAFKVLHTFLEGFQLFIDKSDVPPQINSPNAERRVYASWNQVRPKCLMLTLRQRIVSLTSFGLSSDIYSNRSIQLSKAKFASFS